MAWLTFITNPYALTAVITIILGSSLRYMIKSYGDKRPGYVLASYALFLFAIVSLGIGALATSYYIAGRGAKDPVAYQQQERFALIPTAYAHTGHGHYGWVWAGEVEGEQFASTTLTDVSEIPEVEEFVFVGPDGANLRTLPPKFSWWRLRFVLGDFLELLDPGTLLLVHRVHEAGKQVWLQVEVLD